MFKHITLLTTLILSMNFTTASADQNITIIAPTSEAAEGLDLYAVSELFKETANLEDFEESLNDPYYGINNLDLDGDGFVDFIRVVEEIVNGTHLIILQAAIWENEYQDVATIEVENTGNNYNMHVHGNEVIYGADYYIAPSHVHINAWPIIAWISRPVYRPYHSAYHWKNYPRWWKSHRQLNKSVYHGRTSKFKKRNTFIVTRKARVKKVHRVKFKARTSARVSQHIRHKKHNRKVNTTTNRHRNNVIRSNSNRTRYDSKDHRKKNNTVKDNRHTNRNKPNVSRTTTRTTTVKHNNRPNTTTVKKEVSRTSKNKNGSKTVIKKSKTKTKKSDRDQK